MYSRTLPRITAEDAAAGEELFADRRGADDAVLDWYEAFAARLGGELNNYIAGWDETCRRRGLPNDKRVLYAKVD